MKVYPYLPHTEDNLQEMLKEIGVSSVDELFSAVKNELKEKEPLRLPPPLPEMDLLSEIQKIGELNKTKTISFLGAGAYRHFIPSVVPFLANRSEFVTPYTPYQPELSQGTLQAIFEFQTMIAELFGMDI
ncbi:MAG: glycine dehydrogenase, partial [Candidatus Bathyarchaeia archaeon]